RDRIVQDDVDARAQDQERLRQVPRERVVVVHEQDVRAHPATSVAPASTARITSAFARISRYSLSARESATIPAPAWKVTRPRATESVRIVIAWSSAPSRPNQPTEPA